VVLWTRKESCRSPGGTPGFRARAYQVPSTQRMTGGRSAGNRGGRLPTTFSRAQSQLAQRPLESPSPQEQVSDGDKGYPQEEPGDSREQDAPCRRNGVRREVGVLRPRVCFID